MRSVHGNAVATHRHPDAVGKPDHGYVCRHGIGVAASHAIGNARRPARPTRIHNHTSHAPVYNRYGGLFFAVLLAFLYYLKHTDLTSLTQIGHLPIHNDTGLLSAYELSVFFTTFVFLQFWNMFNARAFETGRSTFHFKDCEGFVAIAAMILIGQVLIVNVGDELFNVVPLHISDWVIIILSTSSVLWIGELLRWWERRLS